MTAWLLPLDSNQPSPVNSRQPSPRWLDRNGIGGERENRTHPTAILQGSPAYPERSPIMVPAVCYDQTSSALQADVSTTITTQANWSVRPVTIRRLQVGNLRLCL